MVRSQARGPKRLVWRKIHLGIDEETLEIRAIEITGIHIGDAPVFPDLLDQITTEVEIARLARLYCTTPSVH